MSALKAYRIIELAEDVAGEYCGKLLADFGAELIKIERPGSGSPTRALSPVCGHGDAAERSGLFAYVNTNKKSKTLELSQAADRERLSALIASADAVIDDHPRDWLARIGLTPEQLEQAHPGLVFCSITGFGLDAAKELHLAQSLNVFHASGWGYHTPSPADPARPPLKGPGRFLADYEAGLDAAICIMSTLYARGRTGAGECIDISEQAVLVSRADTLVGRMLAGELEAARDRTMFDHRGPPAAFACKGGFVYLFITSRAHWAGLEKLMGAPAWFSEFPADWLELGQTDERIRRFRAGFSEWVAAADRDEVCERAQKFGVPLVPVNDAADLQNSEQFRFRGFFQPLRHPVLGEALYPTVPYRLSASPAQLTRHAPLLGQHNEEPVDPPVTRKAAASRPAFSAFRPSRGGPLAGLRVLEMTKVWAGPYAGKVLAFLGAEVIKIESRKNMDEMRVYGNTDPDNAPHYLSLNPEILSIQLNTKTEEGQRYLRALIAQSDIIINNIKPGAMERSGLGYEELRAIKPDIISVSLKMNGNDGPLAYQTGYAPCFAALGGLNYLVGYEGEAPRGPNISYGDSTCGAATALGALAALLHRERSGEGQFVDVSAVECMASLIGDSLFSYSLTGSKPGPDGNRHADMAPHGAYPCRDGAWLSIAVATAAQWEALCIGLDAPELSGDSRFATLAARQANSAALDERIAELTRGRQAGLLAGRLRKAGVPAFKSQDAVDLLADEKLWQREIFTLVSGPKGGERLEVGPPWRLSRNPASIIHGAPRLGEHNGYVFGQILGLSEEKIAALIGAGVID